MKKIVVGVDGSEGSKSALRWAIKEAKVRGAAVVAVQTWDFFVPIGGIGMVAPLYEPDIDLAGEAKAALARTVDEVAGKPHPVAIHQHVVRGGAAPALIKESSEAELLVIGSRGLGSFGGLVLGSTGQHCAQHAHCPVVIIPRELHAAA